MGVTKRNSVAIDTKKLPSPGTDVMIFKNIFAKKFCEKIGVFDSKQSLIMQNFDHNIGF
jgi:hypothetical protein